METGSSFVIEYSKTASKDLKKLRRSEYWEKAKEIIKILMVDPFKNPPPYKELCGEMIGHYSRQINIQYRIVYKVNGCVGEITEC
ncbi:MAG: Txe/YoeB family addiction module toxin [Puniceicoccales bacterium]|jgi:Txe/YoeB family toxin of toxin-antitoxin system|nr:Txe/YoeB family addiction module toxin [Puniceicoccales bacterium]